MITIGVLRWNDAKGGMRFAFPPYGLRGHLAMLHRVDFYLKTNTGSPRLWLEWALIKMGPG